MQLEFLEPLLSADDAARADQYTIALLGISGSELMERAGLAVAHKVEELLGSAGKLAAVPVVVVCGPGNNGGDGWVAARRLWQNGVRVAVISLADPKLLQNEARVAANQFFAAALNESWALPSLDACAQHFTSAQQCAQLLNHYRPNVVVDAIFGTGLKRPASGLYAETISTIGSYKAQHGLHTHLLSVDIPSGLPSDGQVWSGVHLSVDSTLAIQFRKITHFSGPYLVSCGKISCVDIGIKLASPPTARVLLDDKQPPLMLLKKFSPNSYKSHFGHIGVLYGSNGIEGASTLSAYSALRSGAGLVTLLVPNGAKTENFIIAEIMRKTFPSPLDADTLERFTSFVIGSGVSQSRYEVANEILTWALEHSRPIVVDAGALPLLKVLPKAANRKNTIIATPHPGEAARLLNVHSVDIENDRIKSARALLQLSAPGSASVTWVLKGACPIVADPAHGLIVCEAGISTLSVGGSGDVLAGLCAALFAQTDSTFDAALLGVATHLQVGRQLMQVQSRGYLAHEIADAIPKVLFRPSPTSNRFQS